MTNDYKNLRSELIEQLDDLNSLSLKANAATYLLTAPKHDDFLIDAVKKQLNELEKQLTKCKDNVKKLITNIEDGDI